MNTFEGLEDEGYANWLKRCKVVRASIEGDYAVKDLNINDGDVLVSPPFRDQQPFISDSQSDEQRQYAVNLSRAINECNRQLRADYFNRGVWTPFTGRTQQSWLGLVFAKPPEEEIDPKLDYMNEDANGAGDSLETVARCIQSNVQSVGRYGALADMPSQQGSVAQNRSGEVAAKIYGYMPEQIIYIGYTVANGKKVLSEVRLVECEDVQKDEWTVEKEYRLRRLKLIDGVYYNDLFNDKKELIDSATPMINGSAMNFIPFFIFGADANNGDYSKMPLYDIARLNISHFQTDCSNKYLVNLYNVPTVNIFSGLDGQEMRLNNPNGLNLGGAGYNHLLESDRVELLQCNADQIGFKQLDVEEKSIIGVGAQFITSDQNQKTFGASKLEAQTSNSALSSTARNVSAGIEWLLDVCSQMMGGEFDNVYKLNTKYYTDEMTPQEVQVWMQAYQMGLIIKDDFVRLGKNSGVISDEYETDEYLALLDEEQDDSIPTFTNEEEPEEDEDTEA